MSVEPRATIGETCVINAGGRNGVRLGRGAKIGAHCVVARGALGHAGIGLSIGDFSGFGPHTHLGSSGGLMIGRDVSAGPYVTFQAQEHITDDLDVPIRHQGVRDLPITTGDNVWIGARSTFLAGAKVGSYSIVAAGSVVRGELPPGHVIGGVPARVLKPRGGSLDGARS